MTRRQKGRIAGRTGNCALVVVPALLGAAAFGASPMPVATDPDQWLAQTIVNPAAEATKRATEPGDSAEPHRRLSTYEMPPVVVEGRRDSSPYRDDELIGDYLQPRWTAQRLFPGTRIYVIPKGEIDAEQWFQFETPKQGGPTTTTALSEIEFGLPHRLQLDLYLIQQRDTGVAGSGADGNSIEMRYAFADWGRVWGNPAVYLEYTSQTGLPDKYEGKILLGGELQPGWHWGANLSIEQQTSGARSTERQVTAGISHTVIDRRFECGAETRLAWTDVRGARGHYARELEIGPSIRFRPMLQMHIDIAPLFGVTGDSLARNVYAILGWEF